MKSKTMTLEAVGYSDVDAGRKMHTDAIFWIASMTKPMTAACLMMLVDQGKVKLDDPVEKYLPEFKDLWVPAEKDSDHMVLRRPLRQVTVRQLLTHTSGLHFSSPVEQPTFDMANLREAVLSYPMMPLDFEPGTQYRYSNAGINTVGRIVEVLSGMRYEEFMQQRLLEPLGMVDTTFVLNSEQVQRVAKSYRPSKDGKSLEEIPISQLHYPLDDPARHGFPAGGLFSTASDVAAFGQMLLNKGIFRGHRFLSEQSVDVMTSVQTGDIKVDPNGGSGYGLGLSIVKQSGGGPGDLSVGSYGHGGAYSTLLQIDPQRRLVMVLMVQHAGYGPGGGQINSTFIQAALTNYGYK
jgi:CubicO group peptidase (beta-lactamase class C family)